MVLDKLGSSLKETLSKIAKSMFVDEKLIDELVKDIQRALLSSDVNVRLVLDLSKSIKERALKEKPPSGITQKEYLVTIVYEELVKFMGGEGSKIEINKKPFKIMMVGLFGSGKTTSIGKLSKYYSKKGYKVCALGLDVYRPAAMDQLEQLSKEINIPYFVDKKEKDPKKIYREFEKELNKYSKEMKEFLESYRYSSYQDYIEVDRAEKSVLNKKNFPMTRALAPRPEPVW